MRIAVACDHGGFEYKAALLELLQALGHTVTDFGCTSADSVDYADYAIPAAEAVAKGEAERAILLCGTGIGVCIAANKVKGVRCALCGDPVSAELTRAHNDSNALAMGARIIGVEVMKSIVSVWLSTPYSKEELHTRRIEKITAYEKKHL
ncbi:MAG: ribose 5-phosphate isomerase B [Eubacteriales bacterium]|nr:ribose 5-phosphate isomerase B [Eubacteriales bacterium]